jgi:hypothetical protein
MAAITIHFKGFIIKSLAYKTSDPDNDHLISEIYYDLVFADQIYRDLHTTIKQCFQMEYDTDPIELTTPDTGGYRGPFPLEEFDDALIVYHRFWVGPEGRAVKLLGNNRVADCGFYPPSEPVVLVVPDEQAESCGGWLLDGILRWRRPHQPPQKREGLTPIGEQPEPASLPSTESLKRND